MRDDLRLLRIAAMAFVLACSHAQPPAQPASQQTQAEHPPAAITPPRSRESAAAQPVAPRHIYFDYDSADLTGDARSALEDFFREVQNRADLRIRIEGNCDERGTVEYNVALGQRRADAAKKYLGRLGLEPSRISAVSNGKEKPLRKGHDEESWRENRRDDVIASPATIGSVERGG